MYNIMEAFNKNAYRCYNSTLLAYFTINNYTV